MVIGSTGTWKGSFGYSGSAGYQEDETGLQLLGHRYYDSSTGRFTTRDPVKDGRNWYSYCENNPVTRIDADGYQSTGTPPGRAALIRELIEMAEREGARNIGKYIMQQGGKLIKHHVYPQAFKDSFRRAGININKHLMEIPEWFHKYLHRGQSKGFWDWLTGSPARGGWWNNQWAEFFKKNPRATAKQCEAFLKELIERARIGDIPIK